MDQEKKTEIIRILNERGVILPCPRCGNPSFTLIEGYFNEMIQPNTNTLNIGGPSIPSIITACTRCGYLSQHALGALGLLPNNNEKKEEQKKSDKE